MYPLIEDARYALLDAAMQWAESHEARALLERIDAYERSSDRWYGELPDASRYFNEAAEEARGELDELRREAIDKALRGDPLFHTWDDDECGDHWCALDDELPSCEEVIQQARKRGAGDGYLERFVA
jgi:hypothetical protein